MEEAHRDVVERKYWQSSCVMNTMSKHPLFALCPLLLVIFVAWCRGVAPSQLIASQVLAYSSALFSAPCFMVCLLTLYLRRFPVSCTR